MHYLSAFPLSRSRLLGAFTALSATFLLSACVDPTTGQPVSTAPAVSAPALVDTATAYASRSDGRFAVPAIPIEQVPETYRRQVVDYPTNEPAGTIIIDPSKKLLYYVTGGGKAIRYGISVGKDGFGWSGTSLVTNKREWPTWTPPKEMIARSPHLAKWEKGQPGGPTNPLGSRAIYLTTGGVDYGYRIHGTPEWKSIGRNASSGCFRMFQQDVMDLYDRVKGGEKVIVLTASGEMPKGLSIPKPPAPKKAAAPKPEAEATVVPAVVAPALTLPPAPPPGLGGAAGSGPTLPVPALAAPATVTETPAAAPAVPAAPVEAPAAATPAPAAAPAAPACALPLVNGTCPAN